MVTRSTQLIFTACAIKNERGEVIDEVSQNVGFKWVGISDKNEFLLNGKRYKLKGASRHQDYKILGMH